MRRINVLIGGLLIFGLAVGGSSGLGGTIGGWTNANVTDEGVRNASLFAVAQLAQQDNSVFVYQLGSVLQASSQVVAGINYNITLIVQLTNCFTNSTGNSVACTSASQKTCVVIVWYQAWMTPPMKLTNSSCTLWTAVQASSTPNPSNGNSSSLSTTPTRTGMGGIAGGWRNVNVDSQEVQNASLFAVAQLAQQSNSPFLYQLGSVLQASSQVVSGTNYNITLIVQLTNCTTNSTGNSATCAATSQKTCVVIVWYQAWMTPPMKLTNSSCTSWTAVQASSTPSSNNSLSLSTGPEGVGKDDLPGGWSNINVSDPGVQNASFFAVKRLAQQSNDMYSYQLGSVKQASVQVVAGLNYNLTLNIQKTNCLSNAQNSGSCTATSEETCVVIVWFQSWMTPSMQLTSFSCSSWTAVQSIGSQSPPVGDSSILPTSSPPEVDVGDLPGGWSNIDVNDQGVQSASLFSVSELAQQNNSTFLYQLGNVLQASIQVVAGANYNITLTVQLTNCLINSTANSSSCTAVSQETCVVLVWFQAWMSPSMQLTSFSCSSWTAVQPVRSPTPQLSNSTVPPTSPSGRGMGGVLSGGWSNVDVADQRVQNDSFFAVAELARQDNSPFFYQLGGVQQASSQVVAGTNFNITLLVFLTNCPTNSTAKFVSCTITSQKTCVVIVWVQPWMTPPMKLTNSLCSSWTSVLSNSTFNASGSSSTMSTNRSPNETAPTTPATSSTTTSGIAVQVSSSGSPLLSNSSTPPGKSTTFAASDNIPGGWRNANVTDQRVQNASLFAIGELARQNNKLLLYQLGEIQQASSQTVAGVNWNITLVVQVTNCSITTNNSTGSCVAKYQGICVVIVLVQAWMSPPMKLTSSSCTPWTAVQNLRANGTTRLLVSESYLHIICIAILSKIFPSSY